MTLVVVDSGRGGATISRRVLARRLGVPLVDPRDRPADRRAICWALYAMPGDVVTVAHPSWPDPPDCAALAVYNSRWLRGPRPGFVLHPLVDDTETRAAGDAVGFVAPDDERRAAAHKGAGLVARLATKRPVTVARGLPHDQMDAWLSRLAWLVVPSAVEAYGRVVVEAAARGVGVVAADLPGIHETGCAAHYLPTDPDTWARIVDTEPDRAAARRRFDDNLRRQHTELAELAALLGDM